MQDSTTLQVKTFVDEHKCTRQFKNIHANSKWLADKYVDTVRSNPKILVKAFMDTIMREHVVQVSMAQVYGIRNNAFGKIEGTYKEQYAKLWGYMEEVRRTNHGSTIFMKLVDDSLEKG